MISVGNENNFETCNYKHISKRGSGTYGLIYETTDNNGNLYASKYINKDEDYNYFGISSLNEIDILSRIRHPNIIHVIEIITGDKCKIDGIILILPLAEKTLHDIILNPNLTTDQKIPIIYKLAEAVKFMHANNLLHLDIKSSNVVINNNEPLLIDFGLSMMVDDPVIGKYNQLTRVTIDHRPPEILIGNKIYNAAVDVWSFGIMILYFLSSQNIFSEDIFDDTPEDKMYSLVVDKFRTNSYIINLLSGIREKYRHLCIDLISSILNLNPQERPTMKQICDHKLFDEIRKDIVGTTIIPWINFNYNSDQRDMLKLLIYLTQTMYPKSKAELLFLSVDLFNKCSSSYKNSSPFDRVILLSTCLWMSSKLLSDNIIELDKFCVELVKIAKNITPSLILQMEFNIINITNGILASNALYNICENGNELKLSCRFVIMDQDSTLYARTDLKQWSVVMKQYYSDKNIISKDINIKQLFE